MKKRFCTKLGIVIFLIVAVVASISTVQARRRKYQSSSSQSYVDEASVAAPTDSEVCFSPKEPCEIKLTKFAKSAKKSLDVAIYDITLDQLVHEILLQSKKIAVRVIVDERQSKEKNSLVSTLIKGGVNLRIGNQRGIMHNKFMIVDGKMIETGSFNYTNHATHSNNENQIYLSNPKIVERYKRRFEEIWSEARTRE